jgi:hypothetical protein
MRPAWMLRACRFVAFRLAVHARLQPIGRGVRLDLSPALLDFKQALMEPQWILGKREGF